MAYQFLMPGRILAGTGALEKSREYLTQTGEKVLIVTDGTNVKLGLLKRLTNLLDSGTIPYAIYDKIDSEPTDEMILEGRTIYLEKSCISLVALGGGSVLDAMKAIGLIAANSGELSDYAAGRSIEHPLPYMVAIPTTAGTGSEATRFTIITDTGNSVKMLISGEQLMPDTVILDPEFTRTMPPAVTAATGLDALTHGIEAYTSRKAQPLTDTLALSAVRRIFQYLPAAFRDGNDNTAREQMAYAALEAGIAFSNSSVTIVHGMSRPIGANFHVPHGLSNAMLLRECLAFMADGALERFGVLGRAVTAVGKGVSDEEAAEAFLRAVDGLCAVCNIPTLKEYGIEQAAFFRVVDKMAEDALDSKSPQNTRKPVSKEDVLRIYRKLWQ